MQYLSTEHFKVPPSSYALQVFPLFQLSTPSNSACCLRSSGMDASWSNTESDDQRWADWRRNSPSYVSDLLAPLKILCPSRYSSFPLLLQDSLTWREVMVQNQTRTINWRRILILACWNNKPPAPVSMLKYCCPMATMWSSIMGFITITHKAQTSFWKSHFLITLKMNVPSNDNYL